MLKRARQALAVRPLRGLAASVIVHAVVVGLALVLTLPVGRYDVKRGEPLFVELPELPEPAPAGNPAARSAGPVRPQRPAPPPARPVPPAQPVPPSAPLDTPPIPAPPVVASRPVPPPPPFRADEPAPGPSAPEAPAPATPAPAEPEAPAPPAPEASAPTPPPVAAVPPPAAPPVDIRSALGRGGGAGSLHGGGRGGIEGEPIPLDSSDTKFSDYLERLRRKIKANWGFPCIRNTATRECEYKTTSLVVHFGILRDGRLQFVEIVRVSGFAVYDDYAVNAIKFSSPFPPVPPALMVSMRQGSTGVAIMAQFNYIVDTSLTNLLR